MSDNPLKTEAGHGAPSQRNRWRVATDELRSFIKKNRGLAFKGSFWRIVRRAIAIRFSTKGAQLVEPNVVTVVTHHKVMTTYFGAVLRMLSFASGLPFQKINFEDAKPRSRFVLSMQGRLDLGSGEDRRAVHIMRDPRDIIVSGYHYHKWTNEAWAHRLDESGVSYQQKLNTANKTDGLFMEIDHFNFINGDQLKNWDMNDPRILEIRFEDLMSDARDQYYQEIFQHLGFKEPLLALAIDLMKLFEAGSRTGNATGKVAERSHVRSGKSGQWREELAEDHLDYIERELGDVIQKFGYEKSHS